MDIRLYVDSDYEKVKEFVERNGLAMPSEGQLIINEDETGEIKAAVNLRKVIFIEPLVSESPLHAKKLWDYVEKKIIDNGIKIIRCTAERKNIKLFKKLGFYEAFEKSILLEKNYYKEVENGK